MIFLILSATFFILILVLCFFYLKLKSKFYLELQKNEGILKEIESYKIKNDFLALNYDTILKQTEQKNNLMIEISNKSAGLEKEVSMLKEREKIISTLEIEKKVLEQKLENAKNEMIKMQERLASQEKLEADLRLLLEKAKDEITIQNRSQYQSIIDQLKKYTEEKSKEMTKEAGDAFQHVIEKDIKQTILKLQENLSLQQEKLMNFQKPVEFVNKILAGSKEAGTYGEQTIANQLDQMGLKYGIDYLTQVAGKGGNDERLLADIVILIPNSGRKDVLIIDSKSSTKLASESAEFIASIESSVNIFAKKDYKTAVEKKLKELMPEIKINQTHLFVYLPFDRMLSRIGEEKPELLKKFKEKEIGVLTPIILDFLLDSIKLYSAKVEINEEAEKFMSEVRVLIEATGRVLTFVKDLGKSIDLTSKKYSVLKSSVSGRFVPIVNRMAKPLNLKQVSFDDLNEEDLKQIEAKEN